MSTRAGWCLAAEFAAHDDCADVLRCVALALDLEIAVSVRRYGPFVRLEAESGEAGARLMAGYHGGEATADKRKAKKK